MLQTVAMLKVEEIYPANAGDPNRSSLPELAALTGTAA